jgi:hypothetical protein
MPLTLSISSRCRTPDAPTVLDVASDSLSDRDV